MLRNALNNRTFKRFSSVLLVLAMTFAINSAISYAGGDRGRASIAIAIPTDTPRPKASIAIAIPTDTPRPKASIAIAIPTDTPRP